MRDFLKCKFSLWTLILFVIPLVVVVLVISRLDPNNQVFLYLVNSDSKPDLDPHGRPVGAGEAQSVSSHANLITNITILHPKTEEEQILNSSKKADEVSGSGNVKRRVSTIEKLEVGLARARKAIREATIFRNQTSAKDDEYVPQNPIYRNPSAFYRSYTEMERVFKIFVYEEGEPPLVHDGPCGSIYSSEGLFIHGMEMENQFRTKDPDQAHLYYLPFSVAKLRHFVYNSHEMETVIADYVNIIATKYPFWNRSLGADHFMVACHDWGPYTSAIVPHLYNNSIRVLCNANTSEGFRPHKDASLPEINLITDNITRLLGGPSPSQRPVLAFFAGKDHGPIRPSLMKHWNKRDKDIHVTEYLPKNISYHDEMRKSKFCLCPSGYEVASPRIVEAIYTECVPVIISDHYVLPFSDILNWRSFSVQITVDEIPKLKSILMGISHRSYRRMQRRVKQVQRHFVVNRPAKRFDVFHMILHSLWIRRLNIRLTNLL